MINNRLRPCSRHARLIVIIIIILKHIYEGDIFHGTDICDRRTFRDRSQSVGRKITLERLSYTKTSKLYEPEAGKALIDINEQSRGGPDTWKLDENGISTVTLL